MASMIRARLGALSAPVTRAFREGVRGAGPWTLAALAFSALGASALAAPPSLAGGAQVQGSLPLDIVRLAALTGIIALALPALIEARRSGALRQALACPLGRSGWLLGRYLGALGALAFWLALEAATVLGLQALGGGIELETLAALLALALEAGMILALGFVVAPFARSSTAAAFCCALLLLTPLARESSSSMLLLALPVLPELGGLTGGRAASPFLEIVSLTCLYAVGYVLSCLTLACVLCRAREIE